MQGVLCLEVKHLSFEWESVQIKEDLKQKLHKLSLMSCPAC